MSLPGAVSTLPSEADAALARETSRILASRLRDAESLRFQIVDGSSHETVNLPSAAVRLLVRILEEMARGNGVSVIPVHSELTTQQAADMLNISRPSLIQLLDAGKIKHRLVGTHRRVPLLAPIRYKRKSEAARRSALAELAAYDQELGI